LTGGGQVDTFAVHDGGSVSGTLDGGDGIDALDYSAFTGTVHVNLPGHSATGVAGPVNNVEKAGPDISITSPRDQPSTEGDGVSLQIQAHSLFGNMLTFSATGLPPDLAIDAASGLIHGTLTAQDVRATAYTVVVTVADGNDSESVTFSWPVGPAIVIT